MLELLTTCKRNTTLEMFCSMVQKEGAYIEASKKQSKATEAKQECLGVRSILGDVRSSLEAALHSVKCMEEVARKRETEQDDILESNYAANKEWLTL